jgi:hypothetical protein
MRRQDGTNVQRQHRLLDGLGRDAKVAELTHRPARGSGLRIGDALPEVGISPPHAVRLFGSVDQQKKERERPSRHGALRYGESVDQPEQPVERWRVWIPVATGPGRDPKAFDDRERLVTFESPDYPSEGARKPPDIVVEGEIFFARSGRVWHGGKIPQTSASEKGKRCKTATEDYLPGAMGGPAYGWGCYIARERP